MNPLLERKIRRFFHDPLNIAWVVLGVLVLFFTIFFNYFKQYFLKIALIGLFFIMFYWLDSKLYTPAKENVRNFFSGDPFAKKWKAFPVFLLEVYLVYLLSGIVQVLVQDYITPNVLRRWHVILWMAIMFLFYLFGMRKK
jgi:hypothetical protein